ncbi:MAG: hypothetical protein HZR80_20205 [Candidatus Heimdallarchaeota archaeon]
MTSKKRKKERKISEIEDADELFELDSGRASFYTIELENRRRVLPVRTWSKY